VAVLLYKKKITEEEMKVHRVFVGILSIFFIMNLPLFAAGQGEEGSKAESEENSAEMTKKAPPSLDLEVAGLKGPTSIGMMLMFEDPPSLGDGVDLEFSVVPTPDNMVSKLLSKEIDIASLPTNLAANLYNKGAPYVMGGITGFGNLYIVTTRDDVNSVKDLKGKTMYNIAKGSTPDFMLKHLLLENGLDPEEDLTIDFTFNHVEIASNIIAGKVDLALLPEPYVTIVRSKKPELKVAVDIQEEWKDIHGGDESYPISCFVIKEELLRSHPDVVDRFLAAYERSILWVNENPEEAGRLTKKYMEMPAPVVAKAIPNLNLRFIKAAAAKPMVEPYLDVFLSFAPKSIGGSLPDDTFYGGK